MWSTEVRCSHIQAFSFFFLSLLPCVGDCHSSISSSGQGLLSQSVLQLNNQEAFASAGYHSNPGLDSTTGRGVQAGAVHIYNQVGTTNRTPFGQLSITGSCSFGCLPHWKK